MGRIYNSHDPCARSLLVYGLFVLFVALNNGWWDVCVGYMQTNDRLSVYGFVAPMTQEPEIHLYVRKGDSMDTAEEVNDDANAIGNNKKNIM